MKKRLYFLIPDIDHAIDVVDELLRVGVDKQHLHALSKDGFPLPGLPVSSERQRNDTAHLIEHWLWRFNLGAFFAALAALLGILVVGSMIWMMIMLGIMVLTFLAGVFWVQLPHVSLHDFRYAMSRGEVLLLVDVPLGRTYEIDRMVERHHPEVVSGGSSWTIDALGF